MWIDPPYGWRYGFPKIYDSTKPLDIWLMENGYPQEDVNFALNYLRTWPQATDKVPI